MNNMRIEKLDNGVFHVTLGDRIYSVTNEVVRDLEGLPNPPPYVISLILGVVNRFVSLGQYTTWFPS